MSIVVLARDEERCVARCLDSVVGRGFAVVVVDTGSVDATAAIVGEYERHGVRLVHLPWPDSFAEVRNAAIEAVGTGWIVFLDADEWFDDDSADALGECLTSLGHVEDLDRVVFAPIIQHVDRDDVVEDVPRIFLADSGIRYLGAVHEYPVRSDGGPVGLVGLDLLVRHDGYTPAVESAKAKRNRNLRLLRAAWRDDPDNPRWPYFSLRDGLPVLDRAELLTLCAALGDLAEREPETGDRVGARHYYRRALCHACHGLAAMGDWSTVRSLCAELDRVDHGDSPDAHYFRLVAELLVGVPTGRDLLLTSRIRRAGDLAATSAVDPEGRHLDALIAALLDRLKGPAEADRYRELCTPWTDLFFDRSALRAQFTPSGGRAPREG